MNLTVFLIFLHVMTMFVAVALSLGGALYLLMAARTGRTEAIRSFGMSAAPALRLVPALFGLGGIFGLLVAIVGGYNLFAGWLVIAYVLFIAYSISGALFTGATAQHLGAAVATAPDGPLPAEAVSLVQRFYRVEALEITILVLVVFDMVVKPFS